MKHYDDLLNRMRNGTRLPIIQALLNEGADAITELQGDLIWCRNELCLRCGQYKQKHLGACKECKWNM